MPEKKLLLDIEALGLRKHNFRGLAAANRGVLAPPVKNWLWIKSEEQFCQELAGS
jgi:hypothetical protein